jgi:uncharacterized protein YqjF (DUF2071 family)
MPPRDEQRLSVRIPPPQKQIMWQTWQDLLFLHWTWDPAEIQKTLPPGLFVDTFENKAYLGIVPFFMRHVRPVHFPAIPYFSNFLELNVRTYVYNEYGTPGVWFYSLDCNRLLAVIGARLLFHLPYFFAKMSAQTNDARVIYSSFRRLSKMPQPARFQYEGDNPIFRAEPGTLEFFLIERYILFAWMKKIRKLYMGQINHMPYPLISTKADAWDNQMLQINGFSPRQSQPDHTLFSPGVTVRIFPLKDNQ